jgi:hypothetical protein
MESLNPDFQPISPAPSFAQRRSQTWDACTTDIASQNPNNDIGEPAQIASSVSAGRAQFNAGGSVTCGYEYSIN